MKITFTKFCDNKTEHLNIRNKYWINKKAYLSSDKNTRYKHKKYVWLLKKNNLHQIQKARIFSCKVRLGQELECLLLRMHRTGPIHSQSVWPAQYSTLLFTEHFSSPPPCCRLAHNTRVAPAHTLPTLLLTGAGCSTYNIFIYFTVLLLYIRCSLLQQKW